MVKQISFVVLGLAGLSLLMLMFLGLFLMLNQDQKPAEVALTLSATPTNGVEIPPYTPLPSLTPTKTLLPPPTLEPPTAIPQATNTPDVTATLGVPLSGVLPPIHGLATATPTDHVACVPRKDWTLTYEVQRDDALVRIAQAYNTSVQALVEGNCITDADVIYLGQKLRVPGGSHPVTPEYVCLPWQVLTPIDHGMPIDVNGQVTFNWQGSNGRRNLIRVYDSNGAIFWERTIDLRQNETVMLAKEGFVAGSYTWQIFPLDLNFVQIACEQSPIWHFHVEGVVVAPPEPDL